MSSDCTFHKTTFNKAQKQLSAPPKEWHKKIFPFKTLCICGSCKGGVTAEEKYKKLKYGGYTKHVYYHCARSVDYECDEPYITEGDLIQQLVANIDKIRIDEKLLTKRLKEEIERFHTLKIQSSSPRISLVILLLFQRIIERK